MAIGVIVLGCWVGIVARRARRTGANLTGSRHLLEVELGRRYEQTDHLVTVARAAGLDPDAVTPLAGARALALGLRADAAPLADQAAAEDAITAALHRVTAGAAADPQLRNDWTIQRPILELQVTEQRLAGAARVYNDQAAATDTLLRGTGTGPVARALGVRAVSRFEALPIELPADRAVNDEVAGG
ncbi:LemA family protein [Rhodococcus sp. NPDC058505]|uniref:LemA family protein n=1 Tax=Rhodococcus sp. NPDC058505 TaxID=3346531 RepID=UPI0036476336